MPITVVAGPTIAAGQSLSDALDVSTGKSLIRIIVPVTWDPARLSFQISNDNVTYRDLFAAGEMMLNVQAGTTIALAGLGEWKEAWFKFRSGTRDHPVIQSGAAAFTCIVLS